MLEHCQEKKVASDFETKSKNIATHFNGNIYKVANGMYGKVIGNIPEKRKEGN